MTLVIFLDALAVYKFYLVKTEYIIYSYYMLMNISPHSNQPEISSHHADSIAGFLMTFPIMNSK